MLVLQMFKRCIDHWRKSNSTVEIKLHIDTLYVLFCLNTYRAANTSSSFMIKNRHYEDMDTRGSLHLSVSMTSYQLLSVTICESSHELVTKYDMY